VTDGLPRDEDLRAGNVERDAVVQRLTDAFGEGRLELAELDERVARAYAAKTLGELRPLLADLPGPAARRDRGAATLPGPTAPLPAPPSRRVAARGPGRHPFPVWIRWQIYSWVLAVSVNLIVWLLASIANGDLLYFWPAWVAGPWGAAIIAQAVVVRLEGRR